MSLEKHVAKMDDAQLALILRDGIGVMPEQALHALVASIFDAFRDRGESSEDAAEGANTPLEGLERADRQAVAALLQYASENTGVLREAMALFEEEHAPYLGALPAALQNGAAGERS